MKVWVCFLIVANQAVFAFYESSALAQQQTLHISARAGSVSRSHSTSYCWPQAGVYYDPPQPPNDLDCELRMEPNASTGNQMSVQLNVFDQAAEFVADLSLVAAASGYVLWTGQTNVYHPVAQHPNGNPVCVVEYNPSGICANYVGVSTDRACCQAGPDSFSATVSVEWFANYNGLGPGFMVSTDPTIAPCDWGTLFEPAPAFIEPTFIPEQDAGHFQIDRTQTRALSRDFGFDRYTYRHVLTIAIGVVDLDIDSDNNDGESWPERSEIEDNIEDDAQRPGKVIMVNKVDDDQDDVPGFADGLEEKWNGSGGSQAVFVPVMLRLPNHTTTDQVVITFTYSASDPNAVGLDPGSSNELGTHYQAASTGRLRLWTKHGDERRSVLPIPAGHYVAPVQYELSDFDNCFLPDGTMRLFLEAIQPSPSSGADTIKVSVEVRDQNGAVKAVGTDQVRVTAMDLELHDLRAWGPLMSSGGDPRIANNNLDAVLENSEIGGAITDGASICLVRTKPPIDFSASGVGLAAIQVRKRDNPDHVHPQVVGTLYAEDHTYSGGQPQAELPSLPQPFPPAESQDVTDFSTGKAFYIPPESYVDPAYASGSPESLNSLETCKMQFNVWLVSGSQPNLLGSKAFVLRRPPIVLVHGIMSSPSTWSSIQWNESAALPLPTRIYFADWSANGTKGYSENFGTVALAIENALNDYRWASDNGHAPDRSFHGIRYAATRADVVAHSQGGQLTRFYIADDMPPAVDRIGWLGDLLNQRSDGSSTGNWHYSRHDNYGAGCIRRFVTMGSPFKGSPIANFANTYLRPGDLAHPTMSDVFVALVNWYNANDQGLIPMPMLVRNTLFAAPYGGGYKEPTCVADLCQASEAQLSLEVANYPLQSRRVLWFPLVGVALQEPGETPMDLSFWEILYEALPLIPEHPGNLAQLSALDSDMIVPAPSQRNSSGTNSNATAGQSFTPIAHSAMGSLVGETASGQMRAKVGELLSILPTAFEAEWSIGP